ncbi:hypothetical protein AALA79_18740 [Lachnospiraceae bacterium 64-25]
MDYTELKVRLMQQGTVVTPAARKKMYHSRFGLITVSDYATTGGIVAVLDERVYVNIPVKFQGTLFTVDLFEDRLVLKYDTRIIKASFRIIPVPKYALDVERLDDDTPVRELVMTHADRVRISPVHGCGYHCSFCTSNAAYYKEISCEQLDEAFKIALHDPYNKPRHVLISGGTPNEESDSYTWINNIYRYFPQSYPQFDFDVMLSPRGMVPEQTSTEDYGEFLSYLHDECGIKTLSVNLELYNDRLRERFIPNKAAVGKDNYYRFIGQAVGIFGSKSVRSSLVVGLESEEDTLNGVRMLLDCGCLPVLSAFVPAPGTDMANYPAPGVELLLEIVKKAADIAREANLQLGPLCRPCTHNSITVEEGEVVI